MPLLKYRCQTARGKSVTMSSLPRTLHTIGVDKGSVKTFESGLVGRGVTQLSFDELDTDLGKG